MPVFNSFNTFPADVANGVHNLGSHTLKVMLSASAPSPSNTIKTNIAEIAGVNGYTAGGAPVLITSSTQVAGVYSLIANADITWTAVGGDLPNFRYLVLYNDTPTSPVDPLIGWLDYGATVTIQEGSSFTFAINGKTLIGGTTQSV